MAAAPEPSKRQRLVDGPRLLAGIVVAALAAGPVFFLAGIYLPLVVAGTPVEEMAFGLPGNSNTSLPILLLLSIRYAFLPALLPNVMLAAMLAVLGAMWVKARAWTVWLAAGALIAVLVALLVPEMWTMRQLLIALAMTGMVCGAICRAFTRWPEDATAGETGEGQA